MLSVNNATSRRITTYVICEGHYDLSVEHSVVDQDRNAHEQHQRTDC